LFLLSLLVPLHAQNRPSPIRVYLFTAPTIGGFVDYESTHRADSMVDITNALKKKKALTLVASPELADLVVELLSRGSEETGETVRGIGITAGRTFPVYRERLKFKMSAGDYSSEFVTGSDGRLVGKWKVAAGAAAKHIEDWVKKNQTLLIANRARTP
jgi:hypothetical protein